MKDSILAAADSRLMSNNKIFPDTYCKIRRLGNICVAFTGVLISQECQYDVGKIAEVSCIGNLSIFQKAESFTTAIEPYLSCIFSKSPDTLSVTFFGFSGDTTAVITHRYYSSRVAGSVAVEKIISPYGKIILGKSQEILDIIDDLRHMPPTIENIIHLMQIEIDKSVEVGPPIDIVLVTRDSVNWINVKPKCTK